MSAEPARRSEPGEETLAGLWSFTHAALLGRVAHEVNNALNGVMMNLEVLKTRTRPDAPAGGAASFAAAASAQADDLATLTEALLALGRPPRGTIDVAVIARHACALLAPVAAHANMPVIADGARGASVVVDATGARLAVVAALLAVVDAVTAGSAGAYTEGGSSAAIRCTTGADERLDAYVVTIAPRHGAELTPAVVRALTDAGISVRHDSDALRLAFPAAGVLPH